MGKRFLLSAFLILLPAPMFAQLADADAATKAKCTTYLQTPLPAEVASVATPTQWPSCASYKLYSGIGMPADLEAARKCALDERMAMRAGLGPQSTEASIFGGSAMLTTLYANGEGVTRDLPVALRFACEAGGAPAEISLRIKDLEERQKEPSKSSGKFDFCDDITSGLMMGFCAAKQAETDDERRDDALSSLSKQWPEKDRAAFATLLKAEREYAHLHGAGEIDLTGTARGLLSIAAEASLRDGLLAELKAFEAGKTPNGSAQDAAKSDAELNRTYRTTLAKARISQAHIGAIQPEAIRKAQRAWLVYRDDWIAFAKFRYPSVSNDAWLTLMNRDRIALLQDAECYTGHSDKPCDFDGPEEDENTPRPLPL
jgi:uncharacterized protein YecT (DUF1311 family)